MLATRTATAACDGTDDDGPAVTGAATRLDPGVIPIVDVAARAGAAAGPITNPRCPARP
jgi:hypothetical protein